MNAPDPRFQTLRDLAQLAREEPFVPCLESPKDEKWCDHKPTCVPEIEALRHRVTQLQAEQAVWQHTVAELRTIIADTDRELREALDARAAWMIATILLGLYSLGLLLSR